MPPIMSVTERCFGDDITYRQNNKKINENVNIRKRNLSKQTLLLPVFRPKVIEPFCIVDKALKDKEIFSTTYINQSMNFLFQIENEGNDYLYDDDNEEQEEEQEKEQQEEVKRSHRKLLITWISAIHESYELFDSTWYLTISIIDRYLSKNNGKLPLKIRICKKFIDELKLLGCTALWIASKYHEIYTVEPRDFCCIKDNHFSENDIIKMEINVIKTIDFELTIPTALVFLERFYQFGCHYIEKNFDNKENKGRQKQKQKQKDILLSLMKYCGEICLSNYELSLKKPSKIGCAILYYSCIGTGIFSATQIQTDGFAKYFNNYQLHDVYQEIKIIHSLAITLNNDKNSRIYKKYSTIKNHFVTKIPSKMYHKK